VVFLRCRVPDFFTGGMKSNFFCDVGKRFRES